MSLDPYKVAVLNWIANGTGSGIVNAVAGSGKTHLLVEAAKIMSGSVFLGAFGNKAAKELNERLNKAGISNKSIKASTFHSAGFSAIRYRFGNVKIDDNKVNTIIVNLNVPEEFQSFVKAIVSIAKQRGVGVLLDMNDYNVWDDIINHFDLTTVLPDTNYDLREVLRYAFSVLRKNNAMTNVIDFDDMVYFPLVHNIRMFQNDWVLIDEAQDTNNTRRALAKKMLKVGGRLIAVGDPKQAIFGFTGADSNSIDLIRREFNCVEMPLSVTYRCAKSVVQYANTWVPHLEAHENAIEGSVNYITSNEFNKIVNTLLPSDAILCRNTKPLVQFAYSLIRQGIACRVEGRDIGKNIVNLIKKMRAQNFDDLELKLTAYGKKEVDKYMTVGKEVLAEQINDRVETILILIQRMPIDSSIKDLIEEIMNMFTDSDGDTKPMITLSTGHKAKGREWNNVYWIGKNYLQPSKYARQDWQMEQEMNLMYVMATRARENLIIVD